VDLSCNKIVALAGIEVLGALVWLNLSRNSITSLDGVQHLAHLQTLDVADNNLTDIDVLEHNMSLTHVNASTNCINVWPRLTLLPVMRTTSSQQSPPTPPQHTPDLDVSNRDVKIQMWKHMLQQRSQQETVDRLRLQQERQQIGPATPRDEETRPTLRPPSMATPRPQYFVHPNHAAAPPTTSKQITPRSQAVAEPPLAHSSTFLPHHDTPGTHASSAKTASATSRQDLHKALAAVQDHVQHMRKYMKKIVRGSYTRRRLVEWKRANYSARQIQRVWRGYVVRGNLVGYVPGFHDTVVNMEIGRKGGATLLHQVRCVLIRVGKLERQAGIQDEATMALWSQLKQATTDSHNHHRLTRAVSRLQVNEYIQPIRSVHATSS
ncbi:hypothetical protein DYB36_010501, partial [Aphanomyces astaci]